MYICHAVGEGFLGGGTLLAAKWAEHLLSLFANIERCQYSRSSSFTC